MRVGGPSGSPDAATVFPNFFEIDYVRIYQPAPAPVEKVETILVKSEVPVVEKAVSVPVVP